MDVERCFRRAAAFLATATPKDVLETVLPTTGRLDDVAGLVSRVDHVGFLAPASDMATLMPAARAAGFDAGERCFPSTIIARELGELAGTGPVPTTIFHAWGEAADGAPILAEAFMPSNVPTDVLTGWLGAGVGSHVALSVARCGDLRDVVGLMQEAGCRMPAFMKGEPLRNAAEKLTVAYFDGRQNGNSVRLELCHRG